MPGRWLADAAPVGLNGERTRPLPLVVVQARTQSSRLPGKVLADLCGQPLLAWLLERLQSSRLSAGLRVATTTDPADDDVVALANARGVPASRGHPTDVLTRFVAVLEETRSPSLVRISGDSPFIDAATVDAVVSDFLRGGADLVANHREPGWPVGTAVEAVTAEALRRLDELARAASYREHVTLYAYEHPGTFAVRHVRSPFRSGASKLRVCVDTAADLARAREICAEFAPRRDFTVADVVAAFGERDAAIS